MQDKLSPVVYHSYVRTLDTVIIPALGHIKLADLKPVHVQQFVKQLAAMPKMKRNGEVDQSGERYRWQLSAESLQCYSQCLRLLPSSDISA